MTVLATIATRYLEFAEATSGQSLCFEDWAAQVARDSAVLGWLATLPEAKQQPNLVFAAARWHGVPAPGPYEGLRSALLSDDGAIRRTIEERSTQTNEVGRLATLMPAFAVVAQVRDEPVALLEVGTSAGLCLYPDRYDYDWPPLGRLVGNGDLTLRCHVDGPMPVPTRPLPVGWRGGIDLHPVDLRDDDATAWLMTLVWPEQAERRARLLAAIEVARADPPHLVAGDLLEVLPAQIEVAAAYGTVIVFHSAVIMYLDDQQRDRFVSLMEELVLTGACRWVSNEGRTVLPAITRTASAARVGSLSHVLGIDGRAVAWTHQHGAAMAWL